MRNRVWWPSKLRLRGTRVSGCQLPSVRDLASLEKSVNLSLTDAAHSKEFPQLRILLRDGAGGLLHLESGLDALALIFSNAGAERFNKFALASTRGSLTVPDPRRLIPGLGVVAQRCVFDCSWVSRSFVC